MSSFKISHAAPNDSFSQLCYLVACIETNCQHNFINSKFTGYLECIHCNAIEEDIKSPFRKSIAEFVTLYPRY